MKRPRPDQIGPRPRVACEECGEQFNAPLHAYYVYREGKCPSCETWMEAEFEGGRFLSGSNVEEVFQPKEKS